MLKVISLENDRLNFFIKAAIDNFPLVEGPFLL